MFTPFVLFYYVVSVSDEMLAATSSSSSSSSSTESDSLGNHSLNMFWFDIFEDAANMPGQLFVFGKVPSLTLLYLTFQSHPPHKYLVGFDLC
jgi:hypothetical protein